MEAEIARARTMLDWPPDWDDAGAPPIARSAWDLAMRLLAEGGVASLGLRGFMIGPCADGSVDLSWDGDDYHLLLNVPAPESGRRPTYYGASATGGDQPSRGTIGGPAFLASILRWLR